MSDNCVFCKIINGSIPSEKVHETTNVLVFKDINPVAPVHLLLIPKKHIKSVNELQHSDGNIISELFEVASELGKSIPELQNNHRIIVSTGPDAGQVVEHMHFHLIGGRKLVWPPG
ncbi:MAG: HIT domain-containing protein [Deltaproteobacteria bacterium]|nr:HIT domain-containing protein [Deltaproteobacteria bacterium]